MATLDTLRGTALPKNSSNSIKGSGATPVAERAISRPIARKSSRRRVSITTEAETASVVLTKDGISSRIVASRNATDVVSQVILRGIALRLAEKWIMMMIIAGGREKVKVAVTISINNTINNTVINAAIRLWTTKAIQMMKVMVKS